MTSALAIFKLKIPSLLQFEDAKDENHVQVNLQHLFEIERIPCDTYMRERLDELNSRQLRGAFNAIFSALQSGKELEKFVILEGKYLLSLNGTDFMGHLT